MDVRSVEERLVWMSGLFHSCYCGCKVYCRAFSVDVGSFVELLVWM